MTHVFGQGERDDAPLYHHTSWILAKRLSVEIATTTAIAGADVGLCVHVMTILRGRDMLCLVLRLRVRTHDSQLVDHQNGQRSCAD